MNFDAFHFPKICLSRSVRYSSDFNGIIPNKSFYIHHTDYVVGIDGCDVKFAMEHWWNTKTFSRTLHRFHVVELYWKRPSQEFAHYVFERMVWLTCLWSAVDQNLQPVWSRQFSFIPPCNFAYAAPKVYLSCERQNFAGNNIWCSWRATTLIKYVTDISSRHDVGRSTQKTTVRAIKPIIDFLSRKIMGSHYP